MEMLDTLELVPFPPARDRADPLKPPKVLIDLVNKPGLARVRQWDGVEAWLVTRYQDVRDALNQRKISVDPRKPGYPEKNAAYRNVLGQDRNLRTMDDPDHSVQKRMLMRDFSIKRVEEIRPAVQARVDELISNMIEKGPSANIVTDLALPVPTLVICEMLGVPFGDREYFSGQSQLCTSSLTPPDTAAEAGRDLYEYLEKLIEEKDQNPTDDLMSRLVVEQLRTGALSRKDVVELARFILIAGHETTANMIALSIFALLTHPEQLALLRANSGAAFRENAIDEMLRYLSNVHNGRRRVAIDDFKLAGEQIRAGDGLIIMNNVADRDESIFAEPDRFDLTRPNARSHMAFGGGAHRCMGAILSKMELDVVHTTLWSRIPNLSLDCAIGDLTFYDHSAVYGLDKLPVRW